MKDYRGSVVSRHTGMGRQSIKMLRITPGPATEWPITLGTNNELVFTKIRIRIIEAVTFSLTPDFPGVGIGWSSQTGQSDNCFYAVRLDTSLYDVPRHQTENHNHIHIETSPPVPNDQLVLRLGSYISQVEIDEASIVAGRIRAEICWRALDEWGDLPDA